MFLSKKAGKTEENTTISLFSSQKICYLKINL